MSDCSSCVKKLNNKCFKICNEIESKLQSGTSIKSNYIVKFCNPSLINALNSNPIIKLYKSDGINLFAIIQSLLSGLSERERICIVLYYGIENTIIISQAKIAKILNVNQHTVSYYLRMARRKLRSKLLNINNISKIYR